MGRKARQVFAVLGILVAWFGTNASAATAPPQIGASTISAEAPRGPMHEPTMDAFLLGSAHDYLKCDACHVQGIATEDACLYCHTAGGPGRQVYGGSQEIYRGSDREHRAHTARHGGTAYQGCISCHEPHGKSVIPGSALLRDDPAKYVVSRTSVDVGGGEGYGSIIPPVTNQRDFCLDCHGGVTRYGTAGPTPLSREGFRRVFPECATCHSGREHFGVDAGPERGSPSHIMTPESDGTVAWKPSSLPAEGVDREANSCTVCHGAEKDFPHSTQGQFLIERYESREDGLCASCHTDTGSFATATEGVGITY